MLYVVYWILFLDGQTELETLRKIRKAKSVPSIVDVLWHRSRGDFELLTIALELMFELCRSQRLSDEDLGSHITFMLTIGYITYDFVEFLLMELEEDYDESL